MTRLTKAGAEIRSGMAGYAGDQISQNVIEFEKGPNDKGICPLNFFCRLCQRFYFCNVQYGDENNVNAIEFAFDVKTFGKDKNLP